MFILGVPNFTKLDFSILKNKRRTLPECLNLELPHFQPMISLPEEFSKQISVFAPLFSKKVFEHAKVLMLGCLLSVGKRTVCGCLKTLGLDSQTRFHKYHRVLSLAKWSAYQASQRPA